MACASKLDLSKVLADAGITGDTGALQAAVNQLNATAKDWCHAEQLEDAARIRYKGDLERVKHEFGELVTAMYQLPGDPADPPVTN